MFDLIVVGCGASGIFGALIAKKNNPSSKVLVLEKTKSPLAKVRISGGGRCNVTHHCFDPNLLTKYYPRGSKELLGPFHRFGPKQTIEWFESKQVPLKVESDGRCFPVTDNSETIINCLLTEAKKLGIEIRLRQAPFAILKKDEGFEIHFKEGASIFCKKLLLATGSAPEGFEFAKNLGHTIESPVPSLFTFNVPQSSLSHLSGIAVENVRLSVKETNLEESGILLITHFGFSGPAVLRLSAWGARVLYEHEYKVELLVDWMHPLNPQQGFDLLLKLKETDPQKTLFSENPFKLPKNLWKTLLKDNLTKLQDIPIKQLHELAQRLHKDPYLINGKTTHKEEFVTCGGVSLKEVHFKTMESKICPNLYFAGEILDIDGITGGFNFQSAWTTGYIAGSSC